MQRRAEILFCLMATAFAHPLFADELADYGCHLDEITDSYFCSTGPLEGREFVTKSEVEEAVQADKQRAKEEQKERPSEMLPPSPGPAIEPDNAATTAADAAKTEKPAEPQDHFIVMSWNMKALAGEGSDYDRAALVLSQADVAVLQEVNLKGQGKGFINVIANLIQAKTQQKMCRAWVQGANGDRQTYAFLWKENTIGYVDNDGMINEKCGETAATIRQSKKMKLASEATFYFKAQKKMFVVGTVFLDKKPKNPDKSVTDLFKSFDDSKWPVVIAGDLKLGPSNSAFNGARKLDFHSALSSNKKYWDNIWFRGATLSQAAPVNVYEKFADARQEDIHNGFSGIFPVAAEFSLTAPAVDTVSLVSKSKPKPKKKTKLAY